MIEARDFGSSFVGMLQSDFRLIVVGGSIAGHILAHCLHRAGVDFIVLEKLDEIASQEGASVGAMSRSAQHALRPGQ